MLYKQILTPVRNYGIQLWVCRNQINTYIITRYLGTSLMHLGISQMPTSIGTFKCRWLRMKLESSLRSMKKGFSITSIVEAIQLLDNSELVRRLKKKLSWCNDH